MRIGPASKAREPYVSWRVDAATADRLDQLARSEAATYFMVRLASLVPVLAALTGSHTVVIGAAVAGRKRTEFSGIFGPFVDLVPLILHYDPQIDFREVSPAAPPASGGNPGPRGDPVH